MQPYQPKLNLAPAPPPEPEPEPFMIVQRDMTGLSEDDARDWIKSIIDKGMAAGGGLARVSVKPERRAHYLIEVWKGHGALRDQGEPRWHLAEAA